MNPDESEFNQHSEKWEQTDCEATRMRRLNSATQNSNEPRESGIISRGIRWCSRLGGKWLARARYKPRQNQNKLPLFSDPADQRDNKQNHGTRDHAEHAVQ